MPTYTRNALRKLGENGGGQEDTISFVVVKGLVP